jgi:hypothetical protein
MVTRMNLPTTFETMTLANSRLTAKDNLKYTPGLTTLAAAILSDRVPTLLRPWLDRLDIKACSAGAKGNGRPTTYAGPQRHADPRRLQRRSPMVTRRCRAD